MKLSKILDNPYYVVAINIMWISVLFSSMWGTTNYVFSGVGDTTTYSELITMVYYCIGFLLQGVVTYKLMKLQGVVFCEVPESDDSVDFCNYVITNLAIGIFGLNILFNVFGMFVRVYKIGYLSQTLAIVVGLFVLAFVIKGMIHDLGKKLKSKSVGVDIN